MADLQQLIDNAWQTISKGKVHEALEIAKQAFQISPQSPEVQHILGLIASRDGQHELALNLLQQSLNAGQTQRKLRDIAEALFSAGYAQQALKPLNDAIATFGDSADLSGLQSAIYIDLEQWEDAQSSAKRANSFDQNGLAWDLNLSFSALIQQDIHEGFKYATARDDNLHEGSRCPAFQNATPCEVWLKGEQGLGDTLYYLRFVPVLVELGWKFHLVVDHKLVPLLNKLNCFESVSASNSLSEEAFWINVGDLALAAIQCGVVDVPPPLKLVPEASLVERYQRELAAIGPAPYIAVTWRGGPKGKKQKNGVRLLEKVVNPEMLGGALSSVKATIINIQRLPIQSELEAFNSALGKRSADYSALNNNLQGMLAFLSIVDGYVTVSNTNLHLREGLAKSSYVLVNRPFQDWRWLANGKQSPWYPQSLVYRQDNEKQWNQPLAEMTADLSANLADKSTNQDLSANAEPIYAKTENVQHKQLIAEGWEVLSDNIPGAVKKAQSVLNEDPQNARALHLLGWAAVQDFKFDLANTVLSQAADIAPTDGVIWRDYIRCLVLDQQFDQAIHLAEKCLSTPNMRAKSAIHYAMAGAYYKVGQERSALEHYDACLEISGNNLDALGHAGMMRMKLGEGYARLGFKQYSARSQAQLPHNRPTWLCPVLKDDLSNCKILITRDMGLGDELSYLRYLPYLTKSGAKITYWCGAKLLPVLARLDLGVQLVPDNHPMPDPEAFDVAFIVNELPMSVEHLNAPEIAPPLGLLPDPALVNKWRNWLKEQGDGPYIGINWRAGAASSEKGQSFGKLAKSIDATLFAQSISKVNATWISLQRNVTKAELTAFEQILGAPVIDAAGLSDDIDDMLALLSLLDENVGVSNTNMHLRAGLGKGSKVLVQYPGGDWRWGTEGDSSAWFAESKVYRQSLSGQWLGALNHLSQDLTRQYGLKTHQTQSVVAKANSPVKLTKRIIWVTAGEILETESGVRSPLESAQERVINVAQLLSTKGWQSEFLHEGISEVMGGWQGKLPQPGDVVVFSKVMTNHAVSLMKDAKDRGAYVVLDVFNDFSKNAKRDAHQKQLITHADAVISTHALEQKWKAASQRIAFYFDNLKENADSVTREEVLAGWEKTLQTLPIADAQLTSDSRPTIVDQSTIDKLSDNAQSEAKQESVAVSKQLIWIAAGEVEVNEKGIYSPLASTRYRVLIPAANLGPLGWKNQVVNENQLAAAGWGDFKLGAGDVLIVSKSLNPDTGKHIAQAKENGCRIVADFCDNHFERSDQLGEHQNFLLSLADMVTTCSQALKRVIETKTDAPVKYITDSFESDKGIPNINISDPLKLVWFGSATNLDTLKRLIQSLTNYSLQRAVQLDLVTLHPQGHQFAKQSSQNALVVNYIPWSLAEQQKAVNNADIVVIPTIEAFNKSVKSPNRIVEPIWAGKYVIAGHLPAYEAFEQFASITDDFTSAIEWVIENPTEALNRIKAGQAYIAANHTPKLIGELWNEAIEAVLKAPAKQIENSSQAVQQEPSQLQMASELHQYLQPKEVARFLSQPVQEDKPAAQKAYDVAYPVNASFDKPKVAVYTAIFGGYDTAPVVENIDPDIDYYLYTDNAEFNAPSPWQVRILPAVFEDPQVDARRVKVLSHLFLVDYDISVWIDGNFQLKQLTYNLVQEIASRAPVALCRHQFRSCIYEEAAEILRRNIDASTPVIKQTQYYRAHQFPKGFGLHATSFLVRNHKDSSAIKLNIRWWEILSQFSKRDQLSFDYVRWESGIPVLPLPFNLRDNDLYFWGKNGSRGHKVSARRSDEHHGRKLKNVHGVGVSDYDSISEVWSKRFVRDLFALNHLLDKRNITPEKSVLYHNNSSPLIHALPDPRLGDAQAIFKTNVMDRRAVLFLGGYWGHNLLACLCTSTASYTHLSLDAGFNEEVVTFFKERYQSRYQNYVYDRNKFSAIKLDGFDCIVLDDCVELTKAEIDIVLSKVNIGTKLITLGKNSEVVNGYIQQTSFSGCISRLDSTQTLSLSAWIKQPPVTAEPLASGKGEQFALSCYGVWLKQHVSDQTYQLALRAGYGFYFADFLASLEQCNFVDIGANYGLYSILANKNPAIKNIYAFEPTPETYESLNLNIEANKASKVNAYCLAVSNKTEKKTIHIDPKHSGKATMRDLGSENEKNQLNIDCIDEVELGKLINLEKNLPIVVKVDVEGYELIVLRTLMKAPFFSSIRYIYCEVDTDYLDVEELLELCTDKHFFVNHKNGSGKHFDLLLEKKLY